MLRSPSLPLRDYDDYSSPDPLATSVGQENATPDATLSSPRKGRQALAAKPGKNLERIHRKHNNSITSDGCASPTKTVTEQTLSPWKIRVTVEAEPETHTSPTKVTRKTMKIPLRQESSPETHTQPTGRGRRSNNSPAKSKRSGTPVRGRSGSRSRRPSVTDLNITVLGDEAESDDWTKQKSPRKKRNTRPKKQTTEEEWPHEVPLSRPKTRTAAKQAGEFHVRSDSDVANHSILQDVHYTESPELRSIDLNRVSVRNRAASMKQKESSPVNTRQSRAIVQSAMHINTSNRKVSNISQMSYPTPSPTSSFHGSDEADKFPDPTEHHEGFDTILESEGFTMIDLGTIPSARHLISSPADEEDRDSAVRVETTAKLRRDRISPETNISSQTVEIQPKKKPTAIPSYMRYVDGDSEISSGLDMPSSPPRSDFAQTFLNAPQLGRDIARKVTPEPYSSPKLPSPPKQARKSPRSEVEHQPLPKRVVSAGIALQGVVGGGPVPLPQSTEVTKLDTPPLSQDNLFEGFDAGTKRELRAGLRFGEELAKRQKSSSPAAHASSVPISKLSTSHNATNILRQNTASQTQVWRGETVVQHTPVSMGMVTGHKHSVDAWSGDFTKLTTQDHKPTSRDNPTTQTPFRSSSEEADSALMTTQTRRQREWQRERESVSREIAKATSGQVIVIDSDSEDDDSRNVSKAGVTPVELVEQGNPADTFEDEVDETDIWLVEAQKGSSSPPAETRNNLFTTTEQRQQHERAAEVVSKPRRSLIPSPWKRGEDVGEASTMLTTGEVSGLFWQQPDPEERTKFGAGTLAKHKNKLSGGFDVDRMARSPEKVREVESSSLFMYESQYDESRHEDDTSQMDDSFITDNDDDQEISKLSSQSTSSEVQPDSAPVKIPVNFNDSTLSNVNSAPGLRRTSSNEDSDTPRPSTPRSAMKGSRQNLGFLKPNTPPRRVIFNDRSMYLNDDGVESTMSANFDSPQPEPSRIQTQEEKISVDSEDYSTSISKDDEDHEVLQQEQAAKQNGWLGWLWKGKSEEATTHRSDSQHIARFDGSDDLQKQSSTEAWQNTKTSFSSGSTAIKSEPSSVSSRPQMRHHKPASTKPSKFPSYLLAPSYPSDPRRPISQTTNLPTPLATSGQFTNFHFRTLHIIHAKSSRPRFHAPKHIRPELKSILGWTMEVDESENVSGAGVFEWKVGSREVEVLERFMQEVEFGWWQQWDAEEKQSVTRNDLEVDEEDRKVVKWGWTVEELATHLGRIVVGEVIRKEEGSGKK